jgi:hypothetical protein
MKTIRLLSLTMLVALFSACKGQTTKQKESPLSGQRLAAADTSKPKIHVNVNKKYDNKGNVIQFDSSYSYSYSSPNGPRLLNNDSVFHQFRNFYDKQFPSFFNQRNNALFFNDSLFKYDFYNDDFFLKRFELNQKVFQDMYKQMDSVKRNFLQHEYPKGYPQKKI